jgi:hypothetical protein
MSKFQDIRLGIFLAGSYYYFLPVKGWAEGRSLALWQGADFIFDSTFGTFRFFGVHILPFFLSCEDIHSLSFFDYRKKSHPFDLFKGGPIDHPSDPGFSSGFEVPRRLSDSVWRYYDHRHGGRVGNPAGRDVPLRSLDHF